MTANEKKLTRVQQFKRDVFLGSPSDETTDIERVKGFSAYNDMMKLNAIESFSYPVFMLKEAFRLADKGKDVPKEIADSNQFEEEFSVAKFSELLETAQKRLGIKPS